MPEKHLKWYVSTGILMVIVGVLIFTLSGKHAGDTGQLRLPVGTGSPRVALGFSHGVILASDGSLWTWGETELGWSVLGLGSNVQSQAWLKRIGSDRDWVDVAAGGSTTLALKSNGAIWGWGENIYGQLGGRNTNHQSAVPEQSVPGNDWKQVAVAGPHCAALKRDGTLWSWGNNWAGQLGDGTTNYSRVPVQVGSATNWTRIWANLIQNVGHQTDGSLWFWGWDYTHSQKGSSVPIPTRVSPDTNWVDVGMGDWMVFAVKTDGTFWAWGRQAHIYTGATNAEADSSPARVGTESDWSACSQFSQSCPIFLKRDGSMWILDASDRRGVATVTAIVTGLVTNNELNFTADSTTLGGDPAFGVVKNLRIDFQLGGTNRELTFAENSPVRVEGGGQKLTVTRALYGNPRLFRNVATPSLPAATYAPAQLRRIKLPKDIVAFCGGRHMSGAALTSSGEVWTWGDAWGDSTPAVPPLQALSRLLKQLHLAVAWGEPRRRHYDEPWQLGREE